MLRSGRSRREVGSVKLSNLKLRGAKMVQFDKKDEPFLLSCRGFLNKLGSRGKTKVNREDFEAYNAYMTSEGHSIEEDSIAFAYWTVLSGRLVSAALKIVNNELKRLEYKIAGNCCLCGGGVRIEKITNINKGTKGVHDNLRKVRGKLLHETCWRNFKEDFYRKHGKEELQKLWEREIILFNTHVLENRSGMENALLRVSERARDKLQPTGRVELDYPVDIVGPKIVVKKCRSCSLEFMSLDNATMQTVKDIWTSGDDRWTYAFDVCQKCREGNSDISGFYDRFFGVLDTFRPSHFYSKGNRPWDGRELIGTILKKNSDVRGKWSVGVLMELERNFVRPEERALLSQLHSGRGEYNQTML